MPSHHRRLTSKLVALVLLVAAGAAVAAGKDTKSYAELLKAFEQQGWKGTGPAEQHNMALYNWEPTGSGDVVKCSVCDKSEGGWSNHNPASYHNASCPYKAEAYPRTKAYRAKTFDRFGWKGTGPAAKENMPLYGWLHTGDGDKVYCPWCGHIEGGWASHDPAAYHSGDCKCRTKGACDNGVK